jgi:hypothetical protein
MHCAIMGSYLSPTLMFKSVFQLSSIGRVARWYIFIPKIGCISEGLWKKNVGIFWNILQQLGISYWPLLYCEVIWYFSPVLVCFTKTNLATLIEFAHVTLAVGMNVCTSGLPDLSWYMIPKLEKCTKWAQIVPNGDKRSHISKNIPNGQKIFQRFPI